MHNKLASLGFIISLIPVILYLISLLPNANFLGSIEAWSIVYYLVIPVIALALSIWALVKINKTGDMRNKWAATSGTVLGVLMIIIFIITALI